MQLAVQFLRIEGVILFNYLDTTPQAKRRFKYLSCINKDYWLIDWLAMSHPPGETEMPH